MGGGRSGRLALLAAKIQTALIFQADYVQKKCSGNLFRPVIREIVALKGGREGERAGAGLNPDRSAGASERLVDRNCRV